MQQSTIDKLHRICGHKTPGHTFNQTGLSLDETRQRTFGTALAEPENITLKAERLTQTHTR